MRICPQCGNRFSEPIQYCPNDGAQTYEAQENQAPPPDPLLGRVVDGRYRIEQQIGEGGMGVVYLATHTVLHKRLALKILRGDNSKDADVVQRFMQEAQSATSIGHPNIIDISDFGRLPDGSVYFVMEYLDGVSLSKLISKGGSVPMQDALHIVRQIASALEAAHARGIVHRDLKPDNIYIVKQGHDSNFAKVLDFGIAKVGGAASKLTKTGMVFGTPHYMSPEQAAGHSVDQRTDVYALGVIMYEMFTGKVPFDADTFMGILSKHMFEPPAKPKDFQGASLGALENVILHALEKNPDHRYLSMTELIADLETVAAGGTVQMGGKAGVHPPGNLADALEPPAHAEARPAQEGGGGKGLIIALAIVALLIVGGGVGGTVFYFSGGLDDGQALAQAPHTESPPNEPPTGHPVGNPPNTPPSTPPSTPPVANPNLPNPNVPPTTPPVVPPPVVAPPVVQMISIASDPAGAEVLLDGVMVGNTPVRVPRPAQGTQALTLRLRNYEEAAMQISAASQETLTITLEPEHQVVAVRRPPPTPRYGQPTPLVQSPPIIHSPTPPVVSRPRSTSEVVDPWQQ